MVAKAITQNSDLNYQNRANPPTAILSHYGEKALSLQTNSSPWTI
jgi:hypothetical protein